MSATHDSGRDEMLKAWVRGRFRSYARGGLLTLTFLVPVIFTQKTLDLFDLPKNTALFVFVITGVALLVVYLLYRRAALPPSGLIWAAFAFIILNVTATLFSDARLVSLMGLHGRYGGILPLLFLFAVMQLVVLLYWDRPEGMHGIAKASAAGSVVASAYVLLQAAGLDWIQWAPGAEFVGGTLGNSNFSGAYLGIVLPFWVYLSAKAEAWTSRATVGALAGLSLTALWYTNTRGGMIAGAAGLAVMALFYVPNIRTNLKTIGVTPVVIVALTATLVIVALSPLGGSVSALFRSDTAQARLNWWTVAVEVIKQHPVTGTGPDTYYASSTNLRSVRDASIHGLTIADAPHNTLLGYATNAGLPALASYLILIGLAFVYTTRQAKRLKGPERLRLVTFSAVLAAYLAQAVVSIDVVGLEVMSWVALGAIAVAADPRIVTAREQLVRQPSGLVERPTRWSLAGALSAVVALVAVLALALALRPFLADLKAKRAAATRSPALSLFLLNQASELNPLEARYHSMRGAVLARQAFASRDPRAFNGLFASAAASFGRALQLRPNWIHDVVRSAALHSTWASKNRDPSRFAEGESWWRRALKLDPNNPEVRFLHSEALRAWGMVTGDRGAIQRQISELRTALRIRPNMAKAGVHLALALQGTGQGAEAEKTLETIFGRRLSVAEARAILEAPQDVVNRAPTFSRTLSLKVSFSAAGIALVVAGLLSMVPLNKSETHSGSSKTSSSRRFHGTRRSKGMVPRQLALLLTRLPARPGELFAVPAIWSLALAIPYAGLLYGLPSTSRDRLEFFVHFLPGVVLLLLAARDGMLGQAQPDDNQMRDWSLVPAFLGFSMIVAHFLRGQRTPIPLDWHENLFQLAPGLLTLALAALNYYNPASESAAVLRREISGRATRRR